MGDVPTPEGEEAFPGYRSGVAARLAGLPVETLRVWERRYALSDTPRSPRGQRLYSATQVRRLGLLKQLVDQGHSIGQLARLQLEQLHRLFGEGKPLPPVPTPHSLSEPRRFSDLVLASIANTSSALQCECPRQLADLLIVTGSFERYSVHCASRNEADAQLHLELARAAGVARTVLEVAMDVLARAEGLSLAEMPSPAAGSGRDASNG